MITLISFKPSLILLNNSSKESELVFVNSFCFDCSFLVSPILLASFSVSNAMNLSPAPGTSFKPVISTGVDGNASIISLPKSFLSVLTLPYAVPTTIGSPNLNVPFCTNTVTTGPKCLSNLDSTTVPIAYLLGFALYSLISATKTMFSNNSLTPSPDLAEILHTIVSPPHSSGVRP